MRHLLAVAVALLGSTLVLPVSAGRPFATEDAGVLAPRDCEVESFLARVTGQGPDNESALSVQLGCGIGHRTQLSVGIVGARTGGGDHPTSLLLSGKTALVESSDDGPGLVLAWQWAGTRRTDTGLRRDASSLAAVASLPWGGGLLSANLGWARSHTGRQDSTLWALAYERPVATGLDIGAEVYGDDRRPAWLGVGVRRQVTEGFFVDASFALQRGGARAAMLGLEIGF